jgi:hypothetical protein
MKLTTKFTKQDILARLSKASSAIKTVCGVGNNTAILFMLEAHDEIKATPLYRHQVKHAFKEAIKAMNDYRKQLRSSSMNGNRFFCLEDMSEELREKYGDITNEEYFDYWESIGSLAYEKVKPLCLCLMHKYKAQLEDRGGRYAREKALAFVADVLLNVAVSMYDDVARQVASEYSFDTNAISKFFFKFSINDLRKKWRKAWMAFDPDASIDIPEDKFRNIELTIEQIVDTLRNQDTIYDSIIDATKDYGEIFRTKQHHKNAVRDIRRVKSENKKAV